MSARITEAMVKRATQEFLSHRGERPERIKRGGYALWEENAPAMRAALAAALSTEPGEAEETCPVCAKPFKPNDLCSTDIELGTCHAACLQGCPTVDLNTGEPISGPIPTYRYDEDSASPEGWLLVPRDPTEFMIDNAEEAMQERRNFGLKIYAIDVWNAMLVAAPLPEDTHHGR